MSERPDMRKAGARPLEERRAEAERMAARAAPPDEVPWLKVYRLARNIARAATGRHFYPFQEEIAQRIVRSVVENEGAEIAAIVSRQAGKSDAVALVSFGLANAMPLLGLEPIRVGVFGPRLEQSRIIFTRIKDCFNSHVQMKGQRIRLMEQLGVEPQENNGVTFKTNLGSSITSQSASPEAHIEGLTLDLIVHEESQDLDDTIVAKSIAPMGASTNATRVYIGTPGYDKNFFYDTIQRLKGTPECFVVPWDEVVRQKRAAYERDHKQFHLRYEKYVLGEMRRLGPESDAFRTQYKLEFLVERGMFVTFEVLVGKCGAAYDRVPAGLLFPGAAYNYVPVYAGLDIAKTVDQTVLTIGSWYNPLTLVPDGDFWLYDWLELSGDNYEDQFTDLNEKLEGYKNVKCVCIDAQGRGAHMADKFRKSRFPVLGMELTRKLNNAIFQPFLDAVPNRHILRFPMGRQFAGMASVRSLNLAREQRRFIGQLTGLVKEYHGEMLDLHNKEDADDPHDDYGDSGALLYYGAITWREGQSRAAIGEHRMEAHDIFESGGMEGILRADPARELPFGEAADPRRVLP